MACSSSFSFKFSEFRFFAAAGTVDDPPDFFDVVFVPVSKSSNFFGLILRRPKIEFEKVKTLFSVMVFYFGTWNDLKPGDIRGTFLGRFGGTFFIFVFAFSLFDFGLLGALIQMLCEPQRLEFFIAEFASLDFWLRRLRRNLLLWLLGRLLLLLLFLADNSSPFFLVLISCDLCKTKVLTTCFS